MTSWLTRRPLLEPVIDRWWNNVSVQCCSRDCERRRRIFIFRGPAVF